MNKRTLLALGIAAAAGAVALRRLGLRETLDWDDVPKPGHLIDIDGYRVHYVEQGTGPAMVLVHGFGGQTANYAELTPLLAAGHRVIAVDLKGFGYSERDARAGLSASDQVAMLRQLLERLSVGRAVFVGHSMGGGIVQRFAATYPDSVEALVLLASVSGEERMPGHLPPAGLLRPALPLFANLVATRLLDGCFCDRSILTAELREEYVRPARIRGSMDGLLAMARDARRDPPLDVAAITMPVLLLCGAEDRIVPLSVAERIRQRTPQARLVVIERAAHMLLVERPRDCADAIEAFLREGAPAASGTPVASS
jgi:pimeloyl-ACP methyl ester carboxylesterase